MLNFLSKIDDSIFVRYQTVERNIRSKSNSFYDSYLDLLEATIKKILNHESVPFDATRTCGYILRDNEVKVFFQSQIGLDDYTYDKMSDYAKKVNDHKHKDEKWVGIEAVINYMRVYYNLSSLYARHLSAQDIDAFDEGYLNRIFGLTERQNGELKKEVARLKQELEAVVLEKKSSQKDLESYKSLLDIDKIESMSLDDQNQELIHQLNKLKDIKLNSIEHKLNRSIDMLSDLQGLVSESRAVSLGVGLAICGKEAMDAKIAEAKETIKEKRDEEVKNVAEQLSLIEKKIEHVSQERPSLSEIAGISFDEYEKRSVLWLFEPDKQKVEKFKKSRIVLFSLLSIFSAIMVWFGFQNSFPLIQKPLFIAIFSFSLFAYCSYLFATICTKEKTKNGDFLALVRPVLFAKYKYSNATSKTTRAGVLFIVFNILVGLFAFVIFIISLLAILNNATEISLWVGGVVSLIQIVVTYIFLLKTSYQYPCLMIEAEDSYLVWDFEYNHVEKHEKTYQIS